MVILYSAILREVLSDLSISGGAIGAFTYENKDVLIFSLLFLSHFFLSLVLFAVAMKPGNVYVFKGAQ